MRKYGEKKKVGKIETRSDREKREGEKETGLGGRGVCLCLGVTFSAGGGLKGNNGGMVG